MKSRLLNMAVLTVAATHLLLPQTNVTGKSESELQLTATPLLVAETTPEPKDTKTEFLPQTVQNTAFLSNNVLRVYINEVNSNVWEYQYAPGQWGESNYHEHFAIHAPAFGTIESEQFQVTQSFPSFNGGPGVVTGIARAQGIDIQRKVTVLPGDARYFLIEYQITNGSSASINDLRFFQTVDFDIPRTGYHNDDFGWYDPLTDYVGVRDDRYFRNILVSFPRSDNHGVDYWSSQIYDDWDDGQLNGKNSYGPGDAGVAKQFNLGTLAPQQSKSVSFWVWFGDPASISNCVYGRVTDTYDNALANATVALLNTQTNERQERLTDSQGNYRFDNVNAGGYILSASTNFGSIVTGFSLAQGCMYVSPKLNVSESPALIAAAKTYAPTIYQDTDSTKPKADYITAFNYDGNWRGTDNWNNLDQYPLKAYVYWSGGAETNTHYFLQYYFFHPRDWGEKFSPTECTKDTAEGIIDIDNYNFFCHENDMEGIAIAVRKSTGEVNGIVVVNHNDFPICETVKIINSRPVVYSEAKGHALKCEFTDSPVNFGSGGDGIVYNYTNGISEVPESGNDRDVKYDLLNVSELRAKQSTTDSKDMFAENDLKFKGNDYADNRASTPWHLDEGLIARIRGDFSLASNIERTTAPEAYFGGLYADPARVFAALFPNYTYSLDYVFNPNLSSASQFRSDTASVATAPLGDAIITLPFGSLASGATLTVTYNVPNGMGVITNLSGDEFHLASRPVLFQVRQDNGIIPTSFNTPVSVEFLFSQQTLEENNLDVNRLQVMIWRDNAWQPLTTQVDAQTSKVKAFIGTPGVFALFAAVKPSALYFPLVVRSHNPSITPTPTSTPRSMTPTPTSTSTNTVSSRDKWRREAEINGVGK